MRNYSGGPLEIGTESTPQEFVAHLVEVFAQVKRVLHPTATLWVVISDSYNAAGRIGHGTRQGYKQGTNRASAAGQDRGHWHAPGLKEKDLIGIPWMLAFALRDDGWYLRQEVIWQKLSAMPESVGDRCTRSHEAIFMLSKRPHYFYDAMAIAERAAEPRAYPTWEERKTTGAAPRRGDPGQSGDANHGAGVGGNGTTRNARSVWTINPQPFSARAYGVRDIEHYAVFPEELARRCILAGTSEAGCCPRCLAPYRRVVERQAVPAALRNRGNGAKMDFHPRQTGGGQKIQDWYDAHPAYTTGWVPGCRCQAGPPIPCTVLDVFCGSGTTLLVAKKLGRSAIGVDLSAEYCRLAEKRSASTPSTLFSAAILADDGAAAR